MSVDRKAMISVLRRSCVPALRNLGFKGSFPNFYRETGAFVALVNFQFGSAGGSFCVNLGFVARNRVKVFFGWEADPAKLRVGEIRNRVRLGATTGGDHWFVFGNAGANAYRGSVLPPEEIAARCNALLASEAEDWWVRSQGGARG
jgi:Domain of unknown function (DUF4304)